MSRLTCLLSVFVFVFGLQFTHSAFALKRIAPRVDESSADLRALRVYFNYNWANREELAYADRFRVVLAIRDEKVRAEKDVLVAEVKIVDMSDYNKTHVRYVPVTIGDDTGRKDTPGFVDLTNNGGEAPIIRPASVYRLFVNLHRKSATYGKKSAIGRVRGPYYVATSGEAAMDLARQQIVMRTFKEFYYRKQGWRSGERYPMDCYAYYMWATGFCTVGAENKRTRLHRLFGEKTPYHNGGHIARLFRRGPIHADYVRKPGHSFMLLSYDRKQKHVWCMEGNFNSTIEVVIRSVDSGWRVGHLRDEHIRHGVFRTASHKMR